MSVRTIQKNDDIIIRLCEVLSVEDDNAGLRINDVLNKTGSYISASNNTDLGDFYYYLNLGVNVALTQNWELGVMYTGDFASDASSHSGFVKLGYWW